MSDLTAIPLQSAFEQAQFDNVPGFSIDRAKANWRDEWRKTIPMAPQEVMNLLGRDMAVTPRVFVELTGAGQAKFDLVYKSGDAEQMTVEGGLNRPAGTLFLKEVRVLDEKLRRHGIGRQLVANLLDACRLWDLKKMTLRAGREDGPWFWSRRGAYIQDIYVNNFKNDVLENLTELGDRVPSVLAQHIRSMIETSGADLNTRLARLSAQIEDVPIGKLLLTGTNPHMVFSLNNPEQMRLVEKNMAIAPVVMAPQNFSFSSSL